jgi:hypothetical protein
VLKWFRRRRKAARLAQADADARAWQGYKAVIVWILTR